MLRFFTWLPSQNSAGHHGAILALQPQQSTPLNHPPAKIHTKGMLYLPLTCPRKGPTTRQGTHPGEEEGGRQLPGTAPVPQVTAPSGSSSRGNGNRRPAILKVAGRKLPDSSGFLCLDTAGRGWGVRCNSKLTCLWELTANTPAPHHLGKGDAQGPSCHCVRARYP